MSDIYGIIYKATNLINNKMYIGQTTQALQRRITQHICEIDAGSKLVFHRAIKKYGKDNFNWCIIDQAYSKEELDDKEKFWIKFYRTWIKDEKCNGYNMTIGGGGVGSGEYSYWYNKKHSEETKLKISIAQRGEKNHNYGKTASIETRRKISEAHKGEKHHMFGKHHSQETKDKISKANKRRYMKEKSPMFGKKHSDEAKKKISESRIGKYKGEENPHAKAIIQLDLKGNLIAEYSTIKEASIITGANDCNISMCCNNKIKSHKGFIWMFKEDFNEENVKRKIKNYNESDKTEKSVVQIDLNNNIIAIYKNGVEAARAVNKKDSSPISRCCKGKQQTAYGYKWMYEKDLKNK